MGLNRNHLLILTLATLLSLVVLAIVGEAQEIGGRLQLIDALTGAFLIEVGAIAGVQQSTKP